MGRGSSVVRGVVRAAVGLAAGVIAAGLGSCGNRTIRIDLVPVEAQLTPQTIEYGDAGVFTSDKIAVISLHGLLTNMKATSLLSQGNNQVSDLRESLDAIARDPSIKAVLLRINSPGGTVTASDMMYKDLLAFKARTHKPVVTCMMDVCASGGYYVSCASDYRVCYPTTITGSIGVIIETLNINGTLRKIGATTESVKSGPNKDMGSPFKAVTTQPDRALDGNDRELLQNIVNQFYAGFKGIVKASPNHIREEDWGMVTDGRVFTGVDAAKLGLVDEVGTVDTAIAKAKAMAHIEHAKLVMFTRHDEAKGSIYAANPGTPQPQMNMVNVNLDLGDLIPRGESQFLYLWGGFDLGGN
jgi:protease-4